MIVPCQLYSQFTTLSVNFKLTILSKSTHLNLKLSLKLEINLPHFNSQFDPSHLQTQTFQVSTITQYFFSQNIN